MTRLRSLLIAIVALAISAGLAFAARPTSDAAADGLATAAEAAGKTVPVEAEEPEAPEPGENEEGEDGDDEAGAPEPAVEGDNHGALVSEAAHMETPDGFDNHGAFVSCVAKMNHGHEDPDATPTEIVLADLTPEDCAAAEAAAAEARAAARAERAAAREARATQRAADKAARAAARAGRHGG